MRTHRADTHPKALPLWRAKPPHYPLKLMLPTKSRLTWTPTLGMATGPETHPTKIQHPTSPLAGLWEVKSLLAQLLVSTYMFVCVNVH